MPARSRLAVPYGATISIEDGSTIAVGDTLFSWDPYSEPIVADFGGTVRFIDIVDEATVREELDEARHHAELEHAHEAALEGHAADGHQFDGREGATGHGHQLSGQ